MELKQVHKLVDRFFDGATTLEEEKHLMSYFSQKDIDPTLRAYLPYFKATAQDRKQVLNKPLSPVSNRRKPWIRITAIAASFLVGFFVLQQLQKPAPPTAEELVFEEFKANMYMVSLQLNKGMQGVAYMETLNTTTNKYIKTD